MTNPRDIDVRGRSISLLPLTDGQLLIMTRDADRMADTSLTKEQRIRTVGLMFDMFESRIPALDDREYVLDLMRAGSLELKDILEYLRLARGDEEENEVPAPKKTVRRGRPPRKAQ